MSIKHIEDLKAEDLLKFLRDWNLDNKSFLVTEKIDGNAMSFGIENGKFYLSSKNKTFQSPEEVPNLYFMKDFRRFFELLQNVPLQPIVQKLSKKFNFHFRDSIKITGEAVPTYDHNIVVYDKKKIGDGIFVIFSTVIENTDIPDVNFWKELAGEINKHTSVKVFAVPEMDLSKLKFSNELIVSLESIIVKSGNIFSTPARTAEQKEIKDKTLSAIKQVGLKAKQQVLQSQFNSLFGDEYEGIVFRDSTGKLVKIVDKNQFTERKEKNWHFIDQLIKIQNEFKKSIKSNPDDLNKFIVNWKRDLNAIEKDFEKNKDKFITINKKESDTRNEIQFQKSMIKRLMAMLKASTTDEIVQKYLNREIMPEHPAKKGKVLTEGGNVFDDSNSAVPRELLEINIKHALKASGLDNLSFELIGNVNKPFLGDIDIAVDSKELQEKFNLSKENFWADLETFLKKQGAQFKIIKGISQFHLLSDLVDEKGKILPAVSKEGKKLKEPGKIQIDLFVGNVKWLSQTMSGSPKESKYKAVYRNLFLISAFATIKWPTKTKPGVFNKLEMAKDGFKLVQKQFETPSKAKKISESTFSINPDVVAQILFDKSVMWSDINSFEKLYSLFITDKFRFKSIRNDIMKEFRSNLANRKLDTPEEML